MYNTFERNADNILSEDGGEILNKFAKAAKDIAPDSNLFGGPGIITNKYDSKKRYYPNIRTSFMGLVNTSTDKANDRIISYLDKLKEVKPWEDISGKGIISNILSDVYSPNYASELEDHAKEAENNVRELENLFGITPHVHPLLTLLQWSQYTQAIATRDDALKQQQSMQSVLGSVDSPDNAIPGSFYLRKDPRTNKISIYRDKWYDFLDIIRNRVVGAEQHGWTSGADTAEIARGEAPSTYKRRGKISFKEKGLSSVGPEVLRNFHDTIMMPLFINQPNNVFIYCTPDQWESISKGGKLYKAVTGLGRQAYEAGQSQPKVRI